MTSETLKAFGVELRAARVAAGWTLSKLAEVAFGNPDRKGYVSQIEKGRKNINPLTVGKLAEALDLPDDVTRPMLANDDPPVDDSPTPEDEKAAKMIAAAETEGVPGVGESLLVALAYEYAEGDAADLQSAYKGLRAALETAREMAARAELGDNTDASVAAIRARVDALNRDGEPDAAAEVIDEAITQRTAEMAAMLELGVQQDRLRNDPKAASEKLLMWLRLEVADGETFWTRRALQNEWFVKGRDAGPNFEASVAVYLAESVLRIARTPAERGIAGEDLGISLAILGERESGTGRLEEAIAAFRNTSKQWSRNRTPLQWASTQMNLGTTLRLLGERESGTGRLREAVTAYRSALEEWTRDRVPLDWAMTQMNLGNALATVGERERGTDRLEEAVTAYRNALEEWTRERVPLDWAGTQMNLGNTLRLLGERESGTGRLRGAVTSYRNALKECTRDKVPLDWARTQMNLGTTLAILGGLESGTDRLEEAVTAFRAAMEENTRDSVPLEWARTQHCKADLELSFFDKNGDASRLIVAEDYATAALDGYTQVDAPYYIDRIEGVFAEIQQRRESLG